ncbi:transcriptional regulator family: Fungal Specific TF [Penicillium roqueforti]|uniref:Zn(2)-C6 fungal-type DNA-binding domain n=1 Tax=Penicillium roqueforti (strain FM164) TaxID=1365484 RepID=W6PR30_PENRF|nr:transcriptional regulator family: Fungal Specific TF [Penicillium roqueforti]CDM26320.1 Zn(2)-C6 fungal-type DNA-binding domain [Penicillium roqueforti FM164]KAF9242450.1 transcriptional regulator family: Fungal Specific TF [Penicillium roqueforti]KAI1834679.1 transcriptional regulator family: Fungal Specific TF [Penicillium roqueforti]KAI2676523.1 transcriptional regulator family: Fungal Specific TF [Penicillium roqueforti]KAI2681278.1 transcriptional regulator family: Fungal Specific TF [
MPTYPIRRRPRECKTCLPCRASKVRCDRNVPCGNCTKRNFPCSYGRPSSTKHPPPATVATASSTPLQQSTFASPTNPPYTSSAPTTDGSYADHPSSTSADPDLPDIIDISQAEWDEINNKMVAMEQILGSLHSLFQTHSTHKPPEPEREPEREPEPEPVEPKGSTRSEGVYGSNVLKTGAVHLGSRSALVDILDKSKQSEDTAQALPQDDLLAELALGNESAAYPFVDLWTSDPFTFNIAGVCAVLPEDGRCLEFLAFYQDIGAVLYPVLSDTAQLGRHTKRLLDNRRRAGGVYKADANGLVKPFGMPLAFLSLLFAVLASGCQLSGIPESDRELTSWVYVSCAYQCLRMLNYVSQPSVEVIQILLIISNVLSYNMNAGASYTLLGMTERMCLVLGLHVESSGFSLAEQEVRRRVWWTMAFQNSHFSLAYDRPSITMVSQPEIPFDPKSMPGHRSYFETLCRIVSLSLEVLRSRMYPGSSQLRVHEIREYKQQIQRMLAEATSHLRYRDNCRSLAEHIERTELRLHSSYLLSVLCRVSLDPHSHLDAPRRAMIREDCIDSLVNTIDAFVELHEINSHCSRSWISLQRSIASAFLLVANDDSPQTWQLIDRLEMVLADHVYADDEMHQNNRTDSAKHLSSSLRALREIRQAFSARTNRSTGPASSTTYSPLVLPSPPSLEPSPNMPSTNAGLQRMEGLSMRNILGRVSDVMLFPSMSGGNPIV